MGYASRLFEPSFPYLILAIGILAIVQLASALGNVVEKYGLLAWLVGHRWDVNVLAAGSTNDRGGRDGHGAADAQGRGRSERAANPRDGTEGVKGGSQHELPGRPAREEGAFRRAAVVEGDARRR